MREGREGEGKSEREEEGREPFLAAPSPVFLSSSLSSLVTSSILPSFTTSPPPISLHLLLLTSSPPHFPTSRLPPSSPSSTPPSCSDCITLSTTPLSSSNFNTPSSSRGLHMQSEKCVPNEPSFMASFHVMINYKIVGPSSFPLQLYM